MQSPSGDRDRRRAADRFDTRSQLSDRIGQIADRTFAHSGGSVDPGRARYEGRHRGDEAGCRSRRSDVEGIHRHVQPAARTEHEPWVVDIVDHDAERPQTPPHHDRVVGLEGAPQPGDASSGQRSEHQCAVGGALGAWWTHDRLDRT